MSVRNLEVSKEVRDAYEVLEVIKAMHKLELRGYGALDPDDVKSYSYIFSYIFNFLII